MSYMIATPEIMSSAAADLATIGSNVSAAHLAAVAPTVGVIPAAADEVSTGIAHLFSQHAASYQALAGRAAAFKEQFVQHLTAGAFSYASAENAITLFLQNFLNLPNVIADDLAAVPPGWAQIAALLQENPGLNNKIVLVLALLELPFLIPFLLLTSPIWIPLLIVTFPLWFGLAAG